MVVAVALQSDQPVALMLAATADSFCSRSFRRARALDENASQSFTYLSTGTPWLLSRRASMLRATHPLQDLLCRPIWSTLAEISAPDRLPPTS